MATKRLDIGIAIMGYGVVGKGVAHAIRHNAEQIQNGTGLRLRLLHVLDLLDFPGSPDSAVLTHDVLDIMHDGNVDVVVETMGGINAAYEFTKDALLHRKHVVTSNKELVAEYGPELLALAGSCGVDYRFDASVGGGIPAIPPIKECLAANRIGEIIGILNGTTNYMLTYMRSHGAQFAETLKMAQDKGYAEKDPSADIGGADACRKLAILSSIAWGSFLDWKDIHTEGIANAALEDIVRAAELGRVLKLIARARRLEDGKVEAYVLPAMIDRHSPLAGVEGVYNAILVRGDLTGDIMLYGKGAGMLPTGSAIISDIVKAVSGPNGLNVADGQDGARLASGADGQDGASGQDGADGAQGQGGQNGADGAGSISNFCGIYSNPRWDRDAALAAAAFSSCEHGYYVRIATHDQDAFSSEMFKEFPEARILPRIETSSAGSAPTDASEPPSTLVFTVPCMAEGEFSQKLERITASAANTTAYFIARLL